MEYIKFCEITNRIKVKENQKVGCNVGNIYEDSLGNKVIENHDNSEELRLINGKTYKCNHDTKIVE